MAYVYILKCSDGSYYTGSTTDVERRAVEHAMKLPTGAKYTRARDVVEVSCVWSAPTLSSAAKLEYYIKKRLSHAKKQELIGSPHLLFEYISTELHENGYSYSHRISEKELQKLIEKHEQKKKTKQ